MGFFFVPHFLPTLFIAPSLFLPAAATTPVAFKFALQVENYLLGQLGTNTGNKQDQEQQGQRVRGHQEQRVEVLLAGKVSPPAASPIGGGSVKNNLEQEQQLGQRHQGVRGGSKLPGRGTRPKSSNRRKRLRAATEPQPREQMTPGRYKNPTTIASNACRVTQDETRDHAQRSYVNHKHDDPSGSAAEVVVDVLEQQSVTEDELHRRSSSPPPRSTRSTTVSFCDVASHVLGQDLSSFLTIQDLGRLSAVGKNFVTRGRSSSSRSSGNTTPSSGASSTCTSSGGAGATPRSTFSKKNPEREAEDETCPDSTGRAATLFLQTYDSEDEHRVDPISTGTTTTIADHYNIQEDVDCDNHSRASTPCSVKTSGKARHIEETAASTRACLVETLFALSLPEVYTEARRGPVEVNAERTVMVPPVVEPCFLSCHEDHLDNLTGKMEERCAACYKLKPWMVVPTKAEFMAKARIQGVHGKGYEGGVHGIVPPPPLGWTKTPPHTSEVAPGVLLADENTQLGARPLDAKKRQALFDDYQPFQHNQEIKLLEKQLETWSLRSRASGRSSCPPAPRAAEGVLTTPVRGRSRGTTSPAPPENYVDTPRTPPPRPLSSRRGNYLVETPPRVTAQESSRASRGAVVNNHSSTDVRRSISPPLLTPVRAAGTPTSYHPFYNPSSPVRLPRSVLSARVAPQPHRLLDRFEDVAAMNDEDAPAPGTIEYYPMSEGASSTPRSLFDRSRMDVEMDVVQMDDVGDEVVVEPTPPPLASRTASAPPAAHDQQDEQTEQRTPATTVHPRQHRAIFTANLAAAQDDRDRSRTPPFSYYTSSSTTTTSPPPLPRWYQVQPEVDEEISPSPLSVACAAGEILTRTAAEACREAALFELLELGTRGEPHARALLQELFQYQMQKCLGLEECKICLCICLMTHNACNA